LELIVSIALYIPLFLLLGGVIKRGTRWYLPKAELAFVKPPVAIYRNQHGHVREPSYQDPSPQTPEIVSQRHENMWYMILQVPLCCIGALLNLEIRYPILNCVLILPLSIVRFLGFGNEIKTGDGLDNAAATLTVVSIFGLSGVCNALLYLFTRKRLFEHDQREAPRPPSPAIMGESQ
jgi:hypothetical protein